MIYIYVTFNDNGINCYDVAVGDFFQQYCTSLNTPALAPQLDLLRLAIEGYDYDQAMLHVSAMINTLGGSIE